MKKFFLNAVSSKIPGWNAEGKLVSTSDILEKISSDQLEFDPSFVEKKIGIGSVSMTNDSYDMFVNSKRSENNSIYELLGDAIGDVKESLKGDLVAHIHILTFSQNYFDFNVSKTRRKFFSQNIQTIYLQQGCSAILSATSLAKDILNSKSGSVLITAENDMSVHAHRRSNKIAKKDNLNEWLWGSIFGEGVGAILVSDQQKDVTSLEIFDVTSEVIEEDWRVNSIFDGEDQKVIIKAKEVTKTYTKCISKNIEESIEKAGGLDSIDSVCLHESNPNLIRIMKEKFNLPDEKVPSFSSKIGTLAGVSSFSLLDAAFNVEKKPSKIVLCAVGEAGGIITGGHIILRAFCEDTKA